MPTLTTSPAITRPTPSTPSRPLLDQPPAHPRSGETAASFVFPPYPTNRHPTRHSADETEVPRVPPLRIVPPPAPPDYDAKLRWPLAVDEPSFRAGFRGSRPREGEGTWRHSSPATSNNRFSPPPPSETTLL